MTIAAKVTTGAEVQTEKAANLLAVVAQLAQTGNVGPGTQVTGYPTNQELSLQHKINSTEIVAQNIPAEYVKDESCQSFG